MNETAPKQTPEVHPEVGPVVGSAGLHRFGRSSIASLRTRNQLGIAFALSVLIPALVMGLQGITASESDREGAALLPWTAVALVFCISLGFFFVARQAINVSRLRQVLEDLLEGETKGVIELAPVNSDIPAIEHTLGVLRQRMIESREREKIERELYAAQELLERELRERTTRLEEVNQSLQSEVEERRRAVDLKDEFVSTVSHELRTPLAITKEGVNLLLDEIPGALNEKQSKILATIRDNMDRLARIINDLLDISKIEAGKMQMRKSRVSVEKFVSDVLGPMIPVAEKKGITLTAEYDASPGDMYADVDRVIQVLTNLVGNSLKFTDTGGVTVRAAQVDDMVVFRVEDTGVGLTPDETQSVFEKFVQFGRTHGAGIKGTGLGLAISRQIVELHRGEVWVESEKGKGSTFFFSIPLYNEDNVIDETIAGVIEEARDAQEGFILLLFEIVRGESDEAAFLAGFERLLETQAHVRASDLVIPRGENEAILLANVRPDQIGLLYRRWESQVSACYLDSGALDVSLRCGYAQYPEDGSTARRLLGKARQTLSDMGRLQRDDSA